MQPRCFSLIFIPHSLLLGENGSAASPCWTHCTMLCFREPNIACFALRVGNAVSTQLETIPKPLLRVAGNPATQRTSPPSGSCAPLLAVATSGSTRLAQETFEGAPVAVGQNQTAADCSEKYVPLRGTLKSSLMFGFVVCYNQHSTIYLAKGDCQTVFAAAQQIRVAIAQKLDLLRDALCVEVRTNHAKCVIAGENID